MRGVLQDFRFALRQLRKDPGFFAVGVLTLALAVGANTAIFSVVNAFLIRKPHLPDPDRLLLLSSVNLADQRNTRSGVSAPDFSDWRSQATSFDGMAAASYDDVTISGDGDPERVPGARVSADFFHVMGVAPARGRSLGENENGPVAVISNALWRSRFESATDVLGRTLKINGAPYSIVGVMPRSFHSWEFRADVWVPLKFSAQDLSPASRNTRSLVVFARLKPQVMLAQAASEVSAIAQRISAANPDTEKNWSATVLTLQQFLIADANATTALVFLMGTVGFVLLIACANLACLLLARSSARAQEFLTRTVLGASSLRLARQLLAECLCLSLAAACVGTLFGIAGVAIIRHSLDWSPEIANLAKEIYVDPTVLLFTLGIATLAAIVFGMFPALQIARKRATGLGQSSRWATSGRKQHRLQKLLVVSQLALSMFLFVGAGLFVEGFIEEMSAKTGFNADNILTASLSLRGAAYDNSPQKQVAFFSTVTDKLRSDSQVESVAITDALPFNFPPKANFTVEAHTGQAEQKASCGRVLVGPGYFNMLQLPVFSGREFMPSDNADAAPVLVVNRAFAKHYFGSEDPIGRHIRVEQNKGTAGQWSQIVGVVADVNEFLGQQTARPHIYEPFLANPSEQMHVLVRTYTSPELFASSLRKVVEDVDRDQAVTDVRSMRRVISDSGGGDDVMSGLMSAFAFIALAMAAVGTYGVLSYTVSQRTKEMGIRIAVGAEPGQVRRMVLVNGVALAGIGIGVGLLGALAMPKLMAAIFDNFGFHSTMVIAIAPVTVLIIALLACYVPARRAAKVDPMVALRYE